LENRIADQSAKMDEARVELKAERKRMQNADGEPPRSVKT
jgi:hypothetical protein